ncbi:MAG: ATP-binding protein [Planctomycetaceae bacterium]|nr:ATP-binding protein [Planctomycetaceae bacterium]
MTSIQSAKQDRPFRIIALGREKSGKSTFAASSRNPIVLPIKGEEGIDALDVPAFPVVTKFGDLMEAFGALYSSDHPFQTVVVDSVSTLEPLVWDEVCRINKVQSIEQVGKGFGRGYTEALRMWREITEALDALRTERGMGCIMIGHVRVRRFNDPMNEPYDHYSFDINDKAVEMLTRWADGILFFNRKIAVKKEDLGFNKSATRAIDIGGGVPMMYTQERPSHPGGGRGRWGKIPYELAFTETNGWAVLEAELNKVQ